MTGLSISDLAVLRGGVPVLEGISFTLEPGQAVILRGPNGIGKTTLLRTIAGLQPPLAGTVSGAEDRISYAAHADGIKPTLSVTENLTFWASGFGGQDIAPAIAAFRLEALAQRPAGALSAGQKRRLGLARMLVTGRPIWLFDEPIAICGDPTAYGLSLGISIIRCQAGRPYDGSLLECDSTRTYCEAKRRMIACTSVWQNG